MQWYSEKELTIKLERMGMDSETSLSTVSEIKSSKVSVERTIKGKRVTINRLGYAGKDDCSYSLWVS